MAAVARFVGQAAGVVAAVASVVPGGQAIAAIAGAVSLVAGIGAQALAKPPTAIGQINERIIGGNHPQPYLIGRSYTGGLELLDVGYGGEVNDVENPYRWLPVLLSVCGPIKSVGPTLANFEEVPFSGGAATGYYAEYWYRDSQLGARPEAGALTPHFSGAPRWGPSYKLSGCAAVGHNLVWSKKAKRFAGGQIPVIGQVPEGVFAYDPRLDSTYPGGSGPQRLDDENTWGYTRNPALHALVYAYGRFVNGKKVFGVDLGGASISLSDVVAWANVCDANNWFAGGTIYEPGEKWQNLKRICQAGGARPIVLGGILRFFYWAPRPSLYTITRADLASGPIRDQMGRRWKQRHNTIVPRYRSEAHQWRYVQSTPVSIAAFLAEDGEEKLDEIQFDLVTDANQSSELTTYEIYQRRERGPFNRVLKPHMRAFMPGDCLTLGADNSPTGADLKVLMVDRTVDPMSGQITASFETETDQKHIDAIGATGSGPSVIALPSIEELEAALFANGLPAGYIASLIRTAAIKNPRTDADAVRPLVTASESGGVVTVSIARFDLDYPNEASDVTFNEVNLTTEDDGTTPIAAGALRYAYFDYDPFDPATPPVYGLATSAVASQNSNANPNRHALARVTTPASGSGGSNTGSGGGGNYGYDPDEGFEP